MLQDVQRRSGFSNRVLSAHLERHPGLDPRDRGLVTHLVYGVLRHRARLDRHIDAHANRPGKLKGEVRTVLRVAALELRELGHPPHAAISEAVALAAGLDPRGRLRGVVQAIASKIDREGAALDEALEGDAPLAAMVGRWSVPEWIAKRWLAELGPERALERARRLAAPPPIFVRVTAKGDPEDAAQRLAADHPGASIERIEGVPRALRVSGAGDLFYGPLFDEGVLVVQGLSSQVPAAMLGVQPGERVLDACAGMGGKTRQLAEAGASSIVAADADGRRLQRLSTAMARHHENVELRVVEGDLADELAGVDEEAPFDAVLLDAPCTGLGNLARHPEIRWVRQPGDVAQCAALQQRLLSRCLARVAPGGRLVYAVCSPEPEEGRDVVAAVLAGGAAAELVAERQLTPEDDDAEGFYVGLLAVPS